MPRSCAHLILTCLLASLFACASGLKQAEPRPAPGPHRTVVLFLVDGLAVKTLQTALNAGRAPNLRRFFLAGRDSFALGQAAFPTLTYPNITSILTTLPVGQHPILGNLVLEANGKIVAFDEAKNFPELRAKIDPRTVIGTLNREGAETASFSYVFGMNAADHMRVGLREGLDYEEQRYESLDGRLLDNLSHFLHARGSPANWPAFLYVHLVGVDSISHRYGPDSPETQRYVAWLDRHLGQTLAELQAGEAHPGAQVVTLLTADHGFVPTEHFVPLAKLVRKTGSGIKILDEGRFMSLYAPPGRSARRLAPVLKQARDIPGVALTALRRGDILELARGPNTIRFALGAPTCAENLASVAPMPAGTTTVAVSSFRCPNEFDNAKSEYPFLVAQLARYFGAPNHPDALILAEPTTSFTPGLRGNHGGPTAREVFVPVLVRNATLEGPDAIPTSNLLKFLGAPPAL